MPVCHQYRDLRCTGACKFRHVCIECSKPHPHCNCPTIIYDRLLKVSDILYHIPVSSNKICFADNTIKRTPYKSFLIDASDRPSITSEAADLNASHADIRNPQIQLILNGKEVEKVTWSLITYLPITARVLIFILLVEGHMTVSRKDWKKSL